MEKQAFSSRAEFESLLHTCFSRARLTLDLFDPDFGWWQLGSSQMDALLRQFLHGQGRLRLVAHSNARLERDAPRFLRLLQDYSHLIECRRTIPALRQLTDSFCIADSRDIVRRFHADHFRGEAAFDAPAETQISAERFVAVWNDTNPGLHANIAGL
ncbi:hypothetical protein [Massilia sp. YIM B04103]|uniref:DUF7931 domain-containing protein n=1 Tax=Massilia sp. YIM B04103 TaxID=2963106 RepID=UPI00210F0BD7|nr:hypothetical protein [Massilia sp. YIM B04103]